MSDQQQRHTRAHPCPICGGYESMEHGQGKRCFGYDFAGTDGVRYALCTNDNYSKGGKYREGSQGWMHRLDDRPPATISRPTGQPRKRGEIVATYDYRDKSGALVFQVVRYAPKTFRQRRPDGNGGWIWSLKDVRLVPYRLPKLLAADPTQSIYLTEGEKDCDNLAVLGLVATCNPMGAGKWREEYNEYLRGRHVVVLPDADKAGAEHAAKVAQSLAGVAASVKVLDLPGLPSKGDVSDWLADGGTVERLTALADATPEYVPTDDKAVVSAEDWLPRITLLSDVQPETVAWLWPGYLALGKVNLLDGDPGVGKSTLLFDLAARISTGRSMPDDSMSDLDGPAGVVILSAEDGMADTIRPRLDAAGADATRIVAIECLVNGEKERSITLMDLAAIESAIVGVDAKVVIIDPLMAYLGSDTNSHRDQDVRGTLAPLARLAERLGVAIIVIRHLSKGAQSNVLYRGGGSIGIIGAARIALMVGHDPDDVDGPRRILAVAKSNLAAFPPAMAYHMEQADNGTARIVWEGTTHHTASAITAAMQPEDGGERTALDEAKEVLRTILASGPKPAKDAEREAIIAGCSQTTVRRARESLGIKPRRSGGLGSDGAWMWALPETSTPVNETPKMSNELLRCPSKSDEHLRAGMSILAYEDSWDEPADEPAPLSPTRLFDDTDSA